MMDRLLRIHAIAGLAALVSHAPICAAAESPSVQGVLAPTPVEAHSCIAVPLMVQPGQLVTGLTWYHNDSSTQFPQLLLLEGQEGEPPNLVNTNLVIANLGAADLGWGEVTFEVPVTSATGLIVAVFVLPSWADRTGTGLGGGPGLGYFSSETVSDGGGWLSVDGFQWVRLDSNIRMAVSLVAGAPLARSADGSVTPVELGANSVTGWWSDATPPTTEGMSEGVLPEDSDPQDGNTKPLAAFPNPFNPRTNITFYVPTAGQVSVKIFDIRGRLVRSLLSEHASSGSHSVVWEGDDNSQHRVASGVYFVRVVSPGVTHEHRVALVR